MTETVISPQNGSEAFSAVRPRDVMVNTSLDLKVVHEQCCNAAIKRITCTILVLI